MTRTGPSSVIQHLQREQANALRLYVEYKGYHWNVSGPLFHDLHLLFDEHAKNVLETIDSLAERQRMLGVRALYTLEEMRRSSSLPVENGLPATPREMIERLRDAHRHIVQGMHFGFQSADEEKDPGTADLFARFVQVHEKMEWFLRELLHGRSLLESTVSPVEPSEVQTTEAGPTRKARR